MARVLALGCSISGSSGLEQLSALIVRLMAAANNHCWAPQPRTQGPPTPLAAVSSDALGPSQKARLASPLSAVTEHDMDHIKGQVPLVNLEGHHI